MSLPRTMRPLLGPALLLVYLLLPANAGAQNTESDDQQPSSQSQTENQEDQATDESTPDEQLPPQPTDVQSADPSAQDQQYDQEQQPNNEQDPQYNRQQPSQYDRRQQAQPQDDLQFEQEFDQEASQFDQQTDDRQFSQDPQFEQDRSRRRLNQQSQRFDERGDRSDRRQDRRFARDRALDDGRLEGREFDQQALQSPEDLGLRINERDNGLAIVDIDRSSVLIDSGLRPGDVLISVRNQPLRRSVDLLRWVRTLEPGVRVPVQVLRDGRRETIYITGIDFRRWQPDRGGYDPTGGPYLGVVFDDRYPSMALVEIVRPNTAAERAGLRPGDVIRRINGRTVTGLRHATALINQMQPGDEIELEFTRRTTGQTVARLGSRPDARQATFYDTEELPAYNSEIDQDRGVTEYSDDTRSFDDDSQRRVRPLRDDDERFGERLRERAPLRRGLIRPFRNQ